MSNCQRFVREGSNCLRLMAAVDLNFMNAIGETGAYRDRSRAGRRQASAIADLRGNIVARAEWMERNRASDHQATEFHPPAGRASAGLRRRVRHA